VVRHLAERVDREAQAVVGDAEQVLELDVVTIVEEDVLTGSAPVDHVVPAAGVIDAVRTSHADTLTEGCGTVVHGVTRCA
jgi:hypothetical protein